jgi:hypothetical protein
MVESSPDVAKAVDAGETPKPKDVAVAGGVTYAAATRAVRRYQAGRIPAPYRAGLDARTVLGAHIMLGRAFADAVTWKYLSENPVTEAARIRQERKGHNVWTPDQLRRFLLTAKDERLYAVDHAARRPAHLRHDVAAGRVNPKIVSSRLGDATAAFTLDLYTEDVPELHHAAAETVSGLFLDDPEPTEPPLDLP